MIIYCAQHKINGKVYIGQTIRTLEQRKKKHAKDANCHTHIFFSRAIIKYGIDSFDWTILCHCNSQKELNEQEIKLIKQYRATNRKYGYNSAPGGNGFAPEKHSHKHSEATRQLLSQKSKKFWENNPEKQALIKVKQKEWLAKPESRKQLGDTVRKRWTDPVYREKCSKAHTKVLQEQWNNPDYREKQKKILKDRWASPIHREAMLKGLKRPRPNQSEKLKQYWSIPEHRKSRSEISKAMWANPEFRNKRSIQWSDPALRRKTSEKIKALWADPVYREKMKKGRKNGSSNR
jgi:group I intron endonuclease